jgi:hypothetical protein
MKGQAMPRRQPTDRLSPAQIEIYGYAQRALENDSGVSIRFDTIKWGSVDASKAEAVRFRNNFNNLKSKLRRLKQYDFEPLGCYLREAEGGWTIQLIKGYSLLDGKVTVTDINFQPLGN